MASRLPDTHLECSQLRSKSRNDASRFYFQPIRLVWRLGVFSPSALKEANVSRLLANSEQSDGGLSDPACRFSGSKTDVRLERSCRPGMNVHCRVVVRFVVLLWHRFPSVSRSHLSSCQFFFLPSDQSGRQRAKRHRWTAGSISTGLWQFVVSYNQSLRHRSIFSS